MSMNEDPTVSSPAQVVPASPPRVSNSPEDKKLQDKRPQTTSAESSNPNEPSEDIDQPQFSNGIDDNDTKDESEEEEEEEQEEQEEEEDDDDEDYVDPSSARSASKKRTARRQRNSDEHAAKKKRLTVPQVGRKLVVAVTKEGREVAVLDAMKLLLRLEKKDDNISTYTVVSVATVDRAFESLLFHSLTNMLVVEMAQNDVSLSIVKDICFLFFMSFRYCSAAIHRKYVVVLGPTIIDIFYAIIDKYQDYRESSDANLCVRQALRGLRALAMVQEGMDLMLQKRQVLMKMLMRAIEKEPVGSYYQTKDEALKILGLIGKKHHLSNIQQLVDVIKKVMQTNFASEGVAKEKDVFVRSLKEMRNHKENMTAFISSEAALDILAALLKRSAAKDVNFAANILADMINLNTILNIQRCNDIKTALRRKCRLDGHEPVWRAYNKYMDTLEEAYVEFSDARQTSEQGP